MKIALRYGLMLVWSAAMISGGFYLHNHPATGDFIDGWGAYLFFAVWVVGAAAIWAKLGGGLW